MQFHTCNHHWSYDLYFVKGFRFHWLWFLWIAVLYPLGLCLLALMYASLCYLKWSDCEVAIHLCKLIAAWSQSSNTHISLHHALPHMIVLANQCCLIHTAHLRSDHLWHSMLPLCNAFTAFPYDIVSSHCFVSQYGTQWCIQHWQLIITCWVPAPLCNHLAKWP